MLPMVYRFLMAHIAMTLIKTEAVTAISCLRVPLGAVNQIKIAIAIIKYWVVGRTSEVMASSRAANAHDAALLLSAALIIISTVSNNQKA